MKEQKNWEKSNETYIREQRLKEMNKDDVILYYQKKTRAYAIALLVMLFLVYGVIIGGYVYSTAIVGNYYEDFLLDVGAGVCHEKDYGQILGVKQYENNIIEINCVNSIIRYGGK